MKKEKIKWMDGGKLKTGSAYPNGYYIRYPDQDIPVLIDANYEGWKMIYAKEAPKKERVFHFISDSIEIKSPADGKMYDSKSKYYASLKAAGNHVVEAGENTGNRSLQGDYNVRKELTDATRQILNR